MLSILQLMGDLQNNRSPGSPSRSLLVQFSNQQILIIVPVELHKKANDAIMFMLWSMRYMTKQ